MFKATDMTQENSLQTAKILFKTERKIYARETKKKPTTSKEEKNNIFFVNEKKGEIVFFFSFPCIVVFVIKS